MNTARTFSKTASQIALASMGIALLAAGVRADTLNLTNVSAANAATQMSKRYGISVVYRGSVTGKVVTLSAENPDTPAGRVQAVNDLANALGMDFQKVYVVSKVDAGAAVPDVAVDTNAPVVFPALKTPARDAIKLVAGVDGADAQISDAITGDVTFPTRRMTVSKAAALIAAQTGTVWKAYYGLFRPGEGPARLQGSVVGSTTGGQPITVFPLITFRKPPVAAASSATPTAPGTAPLPTGPDVSTIPNTTAYPLDGFSPYGYSPFGDGFNPYGGGYGQYNGFGYSAPGGGTAYPGYVYTPGAGVDPAVPGYNAPGYGYFGPGGDGMFYGGY